MEENGMSFDIEALKDKAKNAAEEVKTSIEYLDVGEAVARAKRAAEKFDKSVITKLRYEFQDNAKYDGLRTTFAFDVTDGATDYRLLFDTEALNWYLEFEGDHYE